ncbi:hypothetical protein HHK36_010160 [Tetracentron sinense]|uniref:Uncharacterized protein n=1 Tax=Tetracentron sinense TaxID=13715 RepID=A0A835DMC0_TETSI|nr:hypothetical protein HHK36_010160 [Tetracentron sinense]
MPKRGSTPIPMREKPVLELEKPTPELNKPEDGFISPPSRPRKRTEDGLTIYTKEDIGIGKSNGGGALLCPFDCYCCF